MPRADSGAQPPIPPRALMFKSMRLHNFKSWADTGELRLAPITGFFGANSSGKSSLLHAFVLMKQTAQSSDIGSALNLGGNHSIIDFGNLSQVCHGNFLERLGMKFTWEVSPLDFVLARLSSPHQPISGDFEDAYQNILLRDDVQYQFLMPGLGSSPEHVRYQSGTGVIEYRKTTDSSLPENLQYELRMLANESDPSDEYAEVVFAELPPPIKCYGFSSEARTATNASSILRTLEHSFELQFLQRLFYLGPLRRKAERTYLWQQSAPFDVGSDGSLAVQALLAARDRGRINARQPSNEANPAEPISIDEHVAQWLRELGLAEVFEVRKLGNDDRYGVLIRATRNARPVPLTDVGFGVSQVLPVLVLLAYVPEGTVVLLEQPEMHLHPASQSRLADILLEAAKVRKLQILVESHSEHLLTRLQRRVAEGSANEDDIELYFCEHDGQESTAIPLAMNDLGEIGNWPPDFFGDALGEAVAMVEARTQRSS